MPTPIYLDHNATTPIDPLVVEAMLPYLYEHFGNPSSAHVYGRKAREAVERARAQVAEAIGARPDEIVFTSGGTESNNTAIRGIASFGSGGPPHVITTAVEHPAVLEPCRALEAGGARVTRLPVDAAGRVRVDDLEQALAPDTVLLTVMHANNEVGTIQPLRVLTAKARARGVPVHTDAAQSVGKIPVDVEELRVDLLSIAGHKLYGPKGIGALYVRSGLELPTLLHGAAHEGGRRAGTENVPGIVGLGAACAQAVRRLDGARQEQVRLRDRLAEGLAAAVPDTRRHGDPEACLPNTLSIGFAGVNAATLLDGLSDRLAASAGAACHAEDVTISTVLEAMRVPREYAVGTVRFSVGRGTTVEEVDRTVRLVADAVARERAPRG